MRIRVAARMRASAVRALLLAGVLALAAGGPAAAESDVHTVRLDAVVTEGAAPINDRMLLQIWSREGRQALELIAERHAAPAEVSLEPGQYRVLATYKSARAVRDIVVAGPSDRRKTINLKAGEIGLELLQRVGGKPVRDPIVWRVARYKRGNGSGAEVAKVSHANPSLLLHEGWYEVAARHGDHTTEHVIEVSAGTRFDYALVKNR